MLLMFKLKKIVGKEDILLQMGKWEYPNFRLTNK